MGPAEDTGPVPSAGEHGSTGKAPEPRGKPGRKSTVLLGREAMGSALCSEPFHGNQKCIKIEGEQVLALLKMYRHFLNCHLSILTFLGLSED